MRLCANSMSIGTNVIQWSKTKVRKSEKCCQKNEKQKKNVVSGVISFFSLFFISSSFTMLLRVLVGIVLCVFVTYADVVDVSNVEELLGIFQNAQGNPVKEEISIKADLDFSELTSVLPLGIQSGSCAPYSGVFHGNGHSIKGLSMKNKERNDYNNAGLFCELNHATIENLVFDSSCSFDGITAGALAVNVTGSLTVNNVTNKAQVSGNTRVGGFVSFVSGLQQSDVVLFESCMNEGNVTTDGWDIGGFIGLIHSNTNATFEFTNCRNIGTISGSVSVGGFAGAFWVNNGTTIHVSNCINDGNVQAWGSDGRCGGLIGYYQENSHLIISKFINNGNISSQNRVGGVLGVFYACLDAEIFIENSLNYGPITGTNFTGGFIGYHTMGTKFNLTISNCTNYGTVSSSSGCGGGFAGAITRHKQMNLSIVNCTNNGSVVNSFNTLGGFIGQFNSNQDSNVSFSGSINNGPLLTNETQGYSFSGGFIGYIFNNNVVRVLFKECSNTALVTGNTMVGGFFW